MKIRRFLICVLALVFLGGPTFAEEGMWLPLFLKKLNIEDMQRAGVKLSAEEIYEVNHSSLKDAIVQFGEGCTGEMVSAEGLLFTNHHCGYSQIQAHSSVEHDYLSEGFWARSLDEELPNPGLTVKFLVRMEDVSDQVNAHLRADMGEKERGDSLKVVFKQIEGKAQEGNSYKAMVKSYFGGNEFYLLVYDVFKDVRLVGTPPNSIGKFGADADNWMWPRHTCDFSVFRVYCAPDGKPAEYSKENVPYHPKHFLPISLSGVKNGDYAMIMGYPGTTQRFLPSWGVRQLMEIQAPSIVKIRGEKLGVYDEFMEANPKVRIQYSSKYAGVANYWKYFIGQGHQLKNNRVAEKKEAIEKDFASWATDKPDYQNVLNEMQDAYARLAKTSALMWYTREAILKGPEIFGMATSFWNLGSALEKKDEIAIEKAKESILKRLPTFFKDYDPALDQKLTSEMLALYSMDIDPNLQPESFVLHVKKCKNDFKAISAEWHEKTIMNDSTRIVEFLKKPNLSILEKDPAYYWLKQFSNNFRERRDEAASEQLVAAQRLFIKGLREMNKGKKYAPDANSTMRLSYGQVKDYEPADAVHYNYKTTLEGVMQKEDPQNPDFIVPSRLKKLYKKKDFGRYGDSNLVTCFLTTNDITGGNSGSPVINGRGELLGLAFDGNWEAMSGDIFYETQLQRTIVVDIRYVLFIIDKYAGAQRLIDELKLTEAELDLHPVGEAVKNEAGRVTPQTKEVNKSVQK